jgi:D-glycero-D-manno-heptose 1,7-bisphosphate phosphatase
LKKQLRGCNLQIHLKERESNNFNGVAFFDRDGVIIKEKNYIKDPDDVELHTGIEKVLNFLDSKNYKIIVITNQSGITRGYFGWEEYIEVTKKMLNLLDNKNGNKISSIFACGAADKNICNWRKPGTGMIYQALPGNLINEKDSILIGDKLSDIQAGKSASIRKLFHVLTGHGEKEKHKVLKFMLHSDYVTQLNSQNKKQFFQPENLEFLYKNLKKII